MKKVKILMKVTGVLLILVALWVAIYIGIWKCFCLPIGNIIESIGVEAEGKTIAVNIFKLIFGTTVSEIVATFIGFVGLYLLKWNEKKSS